MELNAFIKNFEKQFDDELAEPIHAYTVFKEIEEWDSMIALSMIAMVDEEYTVKLTGNEIKQAQTIEDLFNIVKEKR
ncbi:hypothetical protein [Mucilaginibacter sp. dw_454]|uniref:hypothetical protein n=1 Tax=Mucilaginibacter sp. dw_454 TaxID=2720079 RepID=UPI001BD27126|nr:hypothetical protein [Mucilaginibacter sp. dw_454]